MGKLLWCGIVMVLLVSGCGWNGTPTRENTFTPLTSITITAEYSTIAARTSAKLTVIGHFSGYFDKDVTNEAIWVSNAPSVATVTPTNRVKGGDVSGSAQTAELTATVRGIPASIPITVSSATISSITITPETPSIPKGLSQQFKAVGTFLDGTTTTTQDITYDVVWSSSAPGNADFSVVEVGKVLTKLVGTTTIGAEFTDVSGTTLNKSTEMTVIAPVVTAITVSPSNPTVLSIATKQFTATGTYSDGSTADITSQASWSSSNATIATMSGGVASTLVPGTATISASFTSTGGSAVSGNSTLTVTGGSLSSIAVAPATLTLVKNTKTRITATGTFSNGSKRDITGAVAWEPADTGLATVTKSGGNLAWLTTVADTTLAGTTISAKAAGVIGTATLAVNTQLPTLLTLSSATLSLVTQISSQLSATATFPSSPSTQDVTYSDDSANNSNCSWSSNNTSVASVGNDGFTKGRVTGVAAGTAVITADYGGKQNTTTVTVTEAPTLLSVAVSCPSVSVGKQVLCTVMATYSGVAPIDVTRDATAWTVGSENILAVADSINQPGEVIGVSGGSTTLTATFGGKTAPVATITVTP